MKKILFVIFLCSCSLTVFSKENEYDKLLKILEKCEFLDEERTLLPIEIAYCSKISSEIRKRYFNDDFNLFLEDRKKRQKNVI